MAAAALAPAPAASTLSPATVGVAWGIAAVSIWGIYLAFARANVSAGVLPADLALIRYVVAGAIMLPWLLRHSPATLAGWGWRRGIVMSLLAGPLFILVGVSSFLFAPLSHGAVVQPAAITVGVIRETGYGLLLEGESADALVKSSKGAAK